MPSSVHYGMTFPLKANWNIYNVLRIMVASEHFNIFKFELKVFNQDHIVLRSKYSGNSSTILFFNSSAPVQDYRL